MRRTRSFSILIGLSLVLAACGGQSPSPSADGGGSPGASGGGTATGGTVRIGWAGYPDSLNPGNGLLSEAFTMYELVYDTPIAVNSAGEYVPELATEWSSSEDGLTWTMTIRDDATFHDGEPLTAEDVAFSMQLYQDTEDFPFLPSYVEPFTSIEATDETTVTLTTEAPIANFEPSMAFIYVIPKHIWESVEDPVEFGNDEMIGSGPFSLVEASQGEFVELASNTDYWGTPPNVDGVIFQTFEADDARVTALTTGQIDAMLDVPETSIPALQNTEDVALHIAEVGAGGDLTDIIFNVTEDEDCPADDPETADADETGVCSGHPALKDVAVRRALAHAVDKEQLIAVGTGGTGSPGLSLVPPGLGDFYASEVEDYAFDIDQANAMLDEAGYEDTDGDGVRECLPEQDCDDLTFRLNYPADATTGARETEVVQETWQQIGVAVNVQVLDPDALTAACCPAFDFDVIMWGWGSDPDPAFLLGVGLCSEIPSGFSETGYCNPAYDDLYDQQAVELDRDARVDIIHQMQQILVDDVPYVIPYYYPNIEAWRTDTFTGWLEDDPTLGLEDPSSLTVLRPSE
ncbi:MAG TPA: ABC transporter substrate-binding protein [Candidatus Limnocylindria bacterium]|nr:ABC transporter substrate-binding protein [Candidatus Limnocylindria bacterium]